jgi:excisionase family DNA binding protein
VPRTDRPTPVVSTPPERLVVIVAADICWALLSRAGLDRYRRDHRGENARVDATLVAMTECAIHWRALADRGQKHAPSADTVPSFGRMTTGMAAARLGLSARTVRRAISAGHLPAERIGNTYLIARDDVDHYRAAREA